MALPNFATLDAKVFDVVKKSSVFKVKVFDLRGLTIYSSEHRQIGDDRLSSGGWQSARAGKPISQIAFRATFSAFDGEVVNRDLLSSYLPLFAPRSEQVVGVFEVYSDVTPFLNRIKETTVQIQKSAAETQNKLQQDATANQAKMRQAQWLALFVTVGLLVGLYGLLFYIVNRAQNILRLQDSLRNTTQQRLSQSEKMAALGQMVAGVAHQLNTPLAFCKNNIEMAREVIVDFAQPLSATHQLVSLVSATPDQDVLTLDVSTMRQDLQHLEAMAIEMPTLEAMLTDVHDGIVNMAEMVTHLQHFTRVDQAAYQRVDLNQALHSVVYISRSVIPTRVEVIEEYGNIPPIDCHPSQLNQAFLNLIMNAAQAIPEAGKVWVRTRATLEGGVQIEIQDTGCGIPEDILPKIFDLYFTTKEQGEGTGMGLHIAKDIVEQHQGIISVQTEAGKGSSFTVILPRVIMESR